VRFEVITLVLLKITTFWDFIHYRLVAVTDGSLDYIASIFMVKQPKKSRKTRLELPSPADSATILRHVDNYQSSLPYMLEA
jgi:uncharacterized membrane protein YqjE